MAYNYFKTKDAFLIDIPTFDYGETLDIFEGAPPDLILQNHQRFCGVVAITLASHARGLGFEPRQNLVLYNQPNNVQLRGFLV